jgi:ubiquitin C-terminal hydrolase
MATTFGLRNQRGSCWVNATLQAIFRLPELQDRYSNDKADENNPVDLCLQEIWCSKGDEGLKGLYDCIKTGVMPAGEGIGDSHELLEFLCDKLPFLDKLCRFKMSHQVKCVNCDYSDLRTDSLIEFSVTPTAKKQGLIACIGSAVQPVSIADWTCEKCKGKGCSKQLLMATFPDVFVFHCTTLDTSVSYSPLLNINGNRYALSSVVCFNGGHWWTYGRSQPPGSNWVEFNDQHVRDHGPHSFPLSDTMRLLFYYRLKE